MIYNLETREDFKAKFNVLKKGDGINIPSVKIMGNSKNEAFKNYVSLFNRGVYINPLQEDYLRTKTVFNLYQECCDGRLSLN